MIRSIRLRNLFLLIALATWARADDESNLERLRSLPPERRAQLVEALAKFDALPPDQKAAVRDLDAKIAALPDESTRASYLEVLSRYHLWRRTLTEAERKSLDDAAPEARVRKVNALRKAQLDKLNQELIGKPDWIQVSSLNELTLFWTVLHLKIWFALTEEQRTELGQLKARDDRIKRLQEIGRKQKVLEKFQHLRQEFFDEITKAEGNREDKNLKGVRAELNKKTAKRGPPMPQIRPNNTTRKAELNLLQEHKPARVSDSHLQQFEEECPSWLRESLEPLPPDAARRRLVILYRMVFPTPEEIPPPKPKAKPKKPPAGSAPSAPGPGVE